MTPPETGVGYDFDQPVDRSGSWSLRWDRYAGRDVIPLWMADTDFRAPPAVLRALQARLDHGVLGYTRTPHELPEAVARRMRDRYGWHVDPAWVVVIPGTVTGLNLCVRRLTPPDGHILIPAPVYYHFERAAQAASRAFDRVPMVLAEGRWVIDESRLQSLLRPQSRLIMLCNPHNPGGTVFTRAELTRVADLAVRHDLIVCSDEIHAELVLDADRRHVPVASLGPEVSRRTITLLAPNKAFNVPAAGCAIAIIEDPAIRRSFGTDLHGLLPDVSVFGLIAALAAYRGDCDEWLGAEIEYLRKNRDLVESAMAELPALSVAHVEATYLAWIDARRLGREDLAEHLVRHGVALSPGEQFGAPGFLRLNFGTQRARLRVALARLRRAVEAGR